MLRYKNKGYVIEIDLPTKCGCKGYSVECRYLYDKQNEKYLLSMWLKRKNIEGTFKIDSCEVDTQYISGTPETIKSNICKIVEQACSTGFFDHYIENFEYELKCFDKGNELFTQERLGVV